MQMQLDFGILKEGRMKYNFNEPLNKHLDVKINGSIMDRKNWIQGKPVVARECEELALRMALEVYIRSCTETATPINITNAVQILTAIGFDKDAILVEAKSGYFSIFFLFRSTGLDE